MLFDYNTIMGPRVNVQRRDLSSPLPLCSPSTGTQPLPAWQNNSASKPLEVKTACYGVKID